MQFFIQVWRCVMKENDKKSTVNGKELPSSVKFEAQDKAKTDAEYDLILEARNNNEQAFDRLYRRYLPVVVWCVAGFSPPESEKDDLVQEGVIGLIKAIRTYDNASSSFNTYASLCIKHSVISALRKLNRQSRGVYPSELTGIEKAEFSKVAEREDYKSLYKEFIKGLSSFEKKTLSLYISGMSYAAMAEEMKVSVKSVDNAITRIKAKIKKKRGNKPGRLA